MSEGPPPPLETDPSLPDLVRQSWSAWKKHPPRPVVSVEGLLALHHARQTRDEAEEARFEDELRLAAEEPETPPGPLEQDPVFSPEHRALWAAWKKHPPKSVVSDEQVRALVSAQERAAERDASEAGEDAAGPPVEGAEVPVGLEALLGLANRQAQRQQSEEARFEEELGLAAEQPDSPPAPLEQDPVFSPEHRTLWAAWKKHPPAPVLSEAEVLALVTAQERKQGPVLVRAKDAAPAARSKKRAEPKSNVIEMSSVAKLRWAWGAGGAAAAAAMVLMASRIPAVAGLFGNNNTASGPPLCQDMAPVRAARPPAGSEEALHLEEAHQLLRLGTTVESLEHARELLEGDQRRHGENAFWEEREMNLVEALACLARGGDGKARAELEQRGKAFVLKHPQSPYLPYVRKRLSQAGVFP